jgi:hypothetical protein
MVPVQFGQQKTAVTDLNTPSPAIWDDCPIDAILSRPGFGRHFYDNFEDAPLVGTQTTQIGYGKYKVFATTGSGVAPVSAINSVEKMGGAMAFSTDTDNDSASLAQPYPAHLLTGAVADGGKLWFEACIAMNTLLTNTMGWMLLLAETDQWTLATGVPFNGGDAITNGAAGIGFRKGEDALGVVDTVVTDRATSFTNIGASEGLLSAAYAFAKFGLVYDPAKSSDCITFYQDNVALATKYTKAQILATTNLKANALGMIFAAVADSAGTTAASYLKWWRVAQINPAPLT